MSVATLDLPPMPLARRARGWLMAAICIAVITLMLMPLVMSFLASFRPQLLVELRQRGVNPVTMLRQYDSHLPLKAL